MLEKPMPINFGFYLPLRRRMKFTKKLTALLKYVWLKKKNPKNKFKEMYYEAIVGIGADLLLQHT
jgi:hypothetical protein